MKKLYRYFYLFLPLVFVYGVLLLPFGSKESPPVLPKMKPFEWKQDTTWSRLEKEFANLRESSFNEAQADSSFSRLQKLLDSLTRIKIPSNSPQLSELENMFFNLAPYAGSKPEKYLNDYIILQSKLRNFAKLQSINWEINQPEKDVLYRIIYGSRSALEEVWLQTNEGVSSETVRGVVEPSKTPAAKLNGMIIHSGDILVSRGGAPTSALIARGNDYPGNFSHVALAYVSPDERKLTLIESHIERGVTLSTPEEYLNDKKLRILVLRMRYNHPDIKADPLLPHNAAQHAYDEVSKRHIPYDFEMNYNENDKLFCSEVASFAYSKMGIRLWTGLSHISSPGLASWLHRLGVRNFTTQEPSDLEYDPQLVVVAEWHSRANLLQDHMDNAILDAMLEQAEKGRDLGFNLWMLPAARIAKLYSILMNQYGKEGNIPEGMDAATALRVEKFIQDHKNYWEKLRVQVEIFKLDSKYNPPYWRMVEMARKIVNDN